MHPVAETESVCPICRQAVNCTPPSHHLRPGTVLGGRYYLGAALGHGGFGITYVGYDMLAARKVAIKEYFPSGFVNRYTAESTYVRTDVEADKIEFFKKGKRRFFDEATILAGFAGVDGVVDVLDCFEANNTVYIVMEFLDGITLKQYLEQYGNISAEQAINLLMPVMTALKQIHKKNLIHRDISPDNIMLIQQGNGFRIKLIDFGATRNVSAVANKSLTVILKPGFAPIEQYGSWDDQGAWTDVYALCATIYRCITGVTPQASLLRIRTDQLQRPSALGAAIGPYTEQVLLKGMSVSAPDRYKSIDELLQAFTAASRQEQSAGMQHYTSQVPTNPVGKFQNPTYSYTQSGHTSGAHGYTGQIHSTAHTGSDRSTSAGKKKGKANTPVVAIIGIAAAVFLLMITVIVAIPKQTPTKPTANISSAIPTVPSQTPSQPEPEQNQSQTGSDKIVIGNNTNNGGSKFNVESVRLADFAQLLSTESRIDLETKLADASNALQFDLVIVTTYSLDGKTAEQYADDYFDNNQFGVGSDKDGALLLISLGTREWHISTSGKGITAMPDSVINQIGKDIQSGLMSGNYAKAFSIFIEDCRKYVNATN